MTTPVSPDDSDAPPRPRPLLTLLVFAATAAAQGAIVFFLLPRSVVAKYPVAAASYLQGQLAGERLLDFSPLYLYLHVAARWVSAHPESIVLLIQVGCSAASAALLFQMLRSMFPAWLAAAGLIAFVADRGVLAYLTVLEPEPILMFFLVLLAWLITQPSRRAHCAAGITLALSVWTRPAFLPLAVLLPAYLLARMPRKEAARSVVAFIIPTGLLVAALVLRNSLAVGSFVPFVMNPGTVTYEGNNPNSWGTSAVYPPLVDELARQGTDGADNQHAVYRLLARKETGRELTVPEVNEFWSSMALHYLEDHPRHALQLFATKLFHALHSYQWHDVSSGFWNERALAARFVPTLPFGVLCALAIVGLLATVRRLRELAPLFSILAIQLAVTTLAYVSVRQRVATVWVVVFFACAGVQYAIAGTRRFMLAAPLALALGALLTVRTDLMQDETRMWLSFARSDGALAEARQLREQGRLAEAADAAVRAVAAAPFRIEATRLANLSFQPGGYPARAADTLTAGDVLATFDRAVLLLDAGDAEGAQTALTRVVESGVRLKRDFYQSSEPFYYLARAALLKQQTPRALALLREAQARSPGDPSTLALLHALGAGEEHAARLQRYFGEISARLYLGRAALIAGNAPEAVSHLEYVSRALPEYRSGHVALAAALGMAGRSEEGVAEYRQAIRLGMDPVLLEREIVELFSSNARIHPHDAFALYSYGIVLRQFGRYEEALETQEQAQLLRPSEAITTEIASLRGMTD